ncbi:hypothetical protein [Bacillus cereus]|uniref:hypothetical protein n=1 Tax=Bacillus cereus TaxID=1396 RepID=UPI000BF6303B|nr:hypothetical protein [Bacillus cereus]PEQ94771.1 hypothetical protein CN477_30435 [Bacillus cereus]
MENNPQIVRQLSSNPLQQLHRRNSEYLKQLYTNNGENEVKIVDPKGDYLELLQKLGLVNNLRRKP